MYAAICHSDLHEAEEDWYEGHFPFVPGHETIGIVVKVGKKVTRFKVGDYAGIGPTVQSCHECQACKEGRDNYCPKMISSYNSVDYYHGGEITQGGYSTVNVPEELQGMDGTFDAVISTIPSHYDLTMYLTMVKYGGSLCFHGW